MTFYLNGKLSASEDIVNIPSGVTRKINYLAKSNFITSVPADPSTDAIFSNFKIYNMALNESQIQYEYEVNEITTTTPQLPPTTITTTTTKTATIPTITLTTTTSQTTSTTTQISTTATASLGYS